MPPGGLVGTYVREVFIAKDLPPFLSPPLKKKVGFLGYIINRLANTSGTGHPRIVFS